MDDQRTYGRVDGHVGGQGRTHMGRNNMRLVRGNKELPGARRYP
jgi:hypothetical protein